jgi:hypothetical protein
MFCAKLSFFDEKKNHGKKINQVSNNFGILFALPRQLLQFCKKKIKTNDGNAAPAPAIL